MIECRFGYLALSKYSVEVARLFVTTTFFSKKSEHLHWRCNILFLSAFTGVQMIFIGVQIKYFFEITCKRVGNLLYLHKIKLHSAKHPSKKLLDDFALIGEIFV